MMDIINYFCINKIKTKNSKEEIIYKDNNCTVTSYGRIFYINKINKRFLKREIDYLCLYTNEDFTLIRECIELNKIENKLLMLYLLYADNFMLFLIENKYKDFYTALEEFIKEKNLDLLTYKDKVSLLKPVFYRYSRKSFEELKNIKIKIQKIKKYIKENNLKEYPLSKKICLYNLPFKLKNSKLEILKGIEIDLSEKFDKLKHECCFLEDIKEFDRVDIKLITKNDITAIEIKLYYKGKFYFFDN